MKKLFGLSRLAHVGLMLAGLMLASVASAADVAGVVLVSVGDVQAVDAAGNARALTRNASVHEGETIKTQAASRASIRWVDGALSSLGANTELKVETYRFKKSADDRIDFNFTKGVVRMISGLIGKRTPRNFGMKTPVGTIGIRGTDFTLNITFSDGQVGLVGKVNDRGAITMPTSVAGVSRTVSASDGAQFIANLGADPAPPPPAAAADSDTASEDVNTSETVDLATLASAAAADDADVAAELAANLASRFEGREAEILTAFLAAAPDAAAAEKIAAAAESAGVDPATVSAAKSAAASTDSGGQTGGTNTGTVDGGTSSGGGGGGSVSDETPPADEPVR